MSATSSFRAEIVAGSEFTARYDTFAVVVIEGRQVYLSAITEAFEYGDGWYIASGWYAKKDGTIGNRGARKLATAAELPADAIAAIAALHD